MAGREPQKHVRLLPAPPAGLPTTTAPPRRDRETETGHSSWDLFSARFQRRVLVVVLAALTLYVLSIPLLPSPRGPGGGGDDAPTAAKETQLGAPDPDFGILAQAKCAGLHHDVNAPAPADSEYYTRTSSDRFEPGTRPTLIRNVTLWTGARNGTEIVYGDVFLDKGLVQGIGYIPEALFLGRDTDVVDAHGGWVTPGLVDLYSRAGVVSAPVTAGALELDSPNGPILPWLRSVDGLNTHDASFAYAVAGGVTTVQVLPDSGHNGIGGQAFVIKLRKTAHRTPTSMLLEPPYQLNGTRPDPYAPRWRHLVMACGESTRAYGNRMDNMWALRAAFAMARGFRDAQDAFCARVQADVPSQSQAYPEDYRWEALVDVLRGRAKVSVLCEEAVDLDALVRLSQEFKIPIASVQGAHEAYLVPGILKDIYGNIPTIALSADRSRSKRETFRGSEFAPRILAENGFPVAMKSDPKTHNSRYLLFEAQQAHYYGLPPNMALASVTAVPATAAGLSHRIGILREGADADLVLWDSHPLQLGAAPRRVWIDGILQVDADRSFIPIGKAKNTSARRQPPKVPKFDAEKEKAVKYDGLVPLRPHKTVGGRVAFRNVRELYTRSDRDYEQLNFGLDAHEGMMDVIVERGRVTCVGRVCEGENADVVVDLRGGAIVPGMMGFGPSLGIEEIESEPSTGDGVRLDPLRGEVPRVMGDVGGLVRVSDALQFGTRNALVAHRAGVTYATTSFIRPAAFSRGSFLGGLSATFRTGANHGMERAAIIKPVTALHVTIGRPAPVSPTYPGTSVSMQIAALRHLLLSGENEHTETGGWFKKAANGGIPLVIDVSSADIMATLIRLKDEVEEKRGSYMRMVFSRATEAHILADDIAHARIGVILSPSRQFPWSWDERRVIPGSPLTNGSALTTLLQHGVTVGLGTWDTTHVQGTRFDLGWAMLDSNDMVTKKQAYELVTTNLEKLLDLEGSVGDMGELVAYEGGSALDFTSKPVAIVSPARGLVEVW